MRTLIQGGWVVGYHDGKHELIPDGCVVFEGNRIVHVGPQFDGHVDRRVEARGKLVSPGFVNCHLHAATNAVQAVFLDGLKADYFGSNFIGYAAPAPPRSSTSARCPAARRRSPRSPASSACGPTWGRPSAPPTTSSTAIGSPGPGTRPRARPVWSGPSPTSRSTTAPTKAAFAPCSTPVRWTRARWTSSARRAGGPTSSTSPCRLHAAMNQREFHGILQTHGQTPIELLHSIGFLKPRTGLGHCVFHNRHSWCHYPYGDDLKRLADGGVTVVHAPYKYAKMGIALESFERYRAQGVNLAIGTDTYPQDVVHEMRWAALMCRLTDGSFRVGRPQDVFDAATLGGAHHLGRDDLGRLAPGAKADIIVVDLLQMHYGAVHDPIKSLVECGSGRDVETVIVDGQALVEKGQATRVDEQALLGAVQAEGERLWHAVPQWHWSGKTLDEIAPPSYPVRG